MILKKLYLVPLIFGLWLLVTFIISYVVAVEADHVKPILFPYISDTGGWAPESCIFGMMLTIGGLLFLMTVYIRYRQVRDQTERNEFGVVTKWLNNSSLTVGVLVTLGCLIVANFQVNNVFVVHVIGAFLCFGMGTVYQINQVIISFRIYPTFGSKTVNVIRLILSIISIIGFVICNVAGLVAWMQFDGLNKTKYLKEDQGYIAHMISAVAEYTLGFSIIFFMVTFCGEFKMVHFEEPPLIVS